MLYFVSKSNSENVKMIPKSEGTETVKVARKLLAYIRDEGPWYRGEAKEPEEAFNRPSSGSVRKETSKFIRNYRIPGIRRSI